MKRIATISIGIGNIEIGNTSILATFNFALRRDDERGAWRQLLHGVRRDVECRLDRGALARYGHHVVVEVVVAGAYAVRIAGCESPAVARHAAERPCAVGVGERL